MAYTGPRSNCSVLNYHIGVFNKLFTLENNVWVYHGELVTPDIASDLGDMLGGLNSAYHSQYPGVPFPTDPNAQNPGGAPPPGSTGGPDHYPIYMDKPMWAESRKTGVNGYPALKTREVTCIPIPVPEQVFSVTLLKLSCAEYGTPACAKQVSFSRRPGEFKDVLAFGQGNTAECQVEVYKEVNPGETIYFNIRFWSQDLNAPGIDDATAGVTIGGAWPR